MNFKLHINWSIYSSLSVRQEYFGETWISPIIIRMSTTWFYIIASESTEQKIVQEAETLTVFKMSACVPQRYLVILLHAGSSRQFPYSSVEEARCSREMRNGRELQLLFRRFPMPNGKVVVVVIFYIIAVLWASWINNRIRNATIVIVCFNFIKMHFLIFFSFNFSKLVGSVNQNRHVRLNNTMVDSD